VHELIASKLDAVVAGDIRRLMIFAPPQHGKSELVSVRLPAYWFGRHPDDPIILTSYAASLAHSKSRQARDVVESVAYEAVFGENSPYDDPVRTRQDSRSVYEWRLVPPHRGVMVAAGVGGPITGHPAKLGIIDDPFENWEQARSATMREKAWEWYRGTFRTRIWEGGAIVVIMTRWHEDDLGGRLMQQGGWEILRLPALAETQADRDANNKRMGLPMGEGDPLGREADKPLSPRRFSRSTLIEIRDDVGSMVWTAEYQGSPRAPEGNRFKRSWFTIIATAPADADRVRYWDKAGTEDGGAYTAGVRMASKDGRIYIEDVVRGQWSSGQRERVMQQTAAMDDTDLDIWIEQEPGSGGLESAEATIRNLAGYSVHKDKVTGDKDVRLEPFAAQAEAGNVYLVRGGWNSDWIEEMVTVPNGAHRDQADATAGAYNKLTRPRGGARLARARW